MFVSLFFILCSFLFGITISNFLKFLDDWWKKFAFALGFGFLLSTWLTFLISWAFGSLSNFSILFSCAILLGGFLKFYEHKKFPLTKDKFGLVFAILILLILLYLNLRLLPHMDDGRMIAGGNIWGDYPFHFGLIYSFSERPNFPPTYPILINANLAYPFMVNFLSAILLQGGMDLFFSLLLPHLFSYIALLSFIYFLGILIGKKKLVGAILILLFIFNGNWGIYYALQDASASDNPINFLLSPPQAYSHVDPVSKIHTGKDNIEFMNQLFSIFLPQRSAIMGFTVAVLFYYLVLLSIRKPEPPALLIAGIILGLMPLVHGHSFLIAASFSPFAFAYSLYLSPNRKKAFKSWLFLIIPSLALAIPQILFIFPQVESSNMLDYRFGWMQNTPITIPDFILFWLQNLGVILPLAAIGLYFSSNFNRLIYAPFFALFLFGNLFQLAPWDWDTIKVFTPWFLFTCVFAAIALEKIFSLKKTIFKASAILLIIFAISSGILTLFWWHDDLPVLYSQRDFAIANWVKENTPGDAIWITSDAHTHVIPSLTGRQTLLGLKWYLYSHGLEKQKLPVETDVYRFFQTADCAIPKKYGADYVFLGIQEEHIEKAKREKFENNPNYEVIFDETLQNYRTTIFKIKCP